ncbi:MAG: zinc-binding alcohol dehydrogenase family protein [Pseudomonadales bacterium]|nr:zinc-binding alcohol dehydrogenase family protein [Pseudomonadales bacterium]
MKAAVYYQTGNPSVLQYEDVADPECRPKGVLIEVKAIGIQGGDTLNRLGGMMASKPHVVGYQAAGIIREIGNQVTDRKVGDRVVATMAFGSHAELVSVAASASYLLPDSLDLELAAGVPIEFGTAADCLFEFGDLKKGETVLIQAGGGGVGLAAIQLAKRAGATVLATASSDEKLNRLRDFGLDHGINYKTEDFVARTRELTEGRGADLIVDSVGGRTLEGSVSALAYRGRISWVGNAGREGPANLGGLGLKNARVTGVFLGAEMGANPARCRKMIEGLLADVAKGELQVVIDQKFSLRDASAAHAYIEGRGSFGRVLLVP